MANLELIKIAMKDFFELRGDTTGCLQMLINLLPLQVDTVNKLVDVKLVDLINITDFVEMPKLLRYYQRDQVDRCLKLLTHDKHIL